MGEIPPLLIPLIILLGLLLAILLLYFVFRLLGGMTVAFKVPDTRYMGSTTFLIGVSGAYKEAVIPIPIEGVVIGSNAADSNIILSDYEVSPRHVRVSFPEGRYDSVEVENVCSSAMTFYLTGEMWHVLMGKKTFSQSEPVKIRIGAHQDIFEITFRL